MWVISLKLRHDDCPIVTRCQKFKLNVLSYPSSWYEKNGKKFATTTCYFQNSKELQKHQYLKALRADKRITRLEVAGDIFTFEINLGSKGEHVMLYHTRNIFFVKPVVNNLDGHEYWHVAAWTKPELDVFVKNLQKKMDVCEILEVKNSKLTDVYFPNVMPKLTKQQKMAIELAQENGYYEYPRKITLEKLARRATVKLSTFQEHLRKAELKLLPVIIQHNRKAE